MDGTCTVDGLDAGTYTVTLCDAKGIPHVLESSGKITFTYDVKSPRDVATGQASGKRQHKPITITKEFDKTKPDNMITIVDNGSSITFKTTASDSWSSPKIK
ncbi:MAG: type VI secretion system tube protein Hcp [Ignavibacteriae bacterium]|nr:type VI secretion system tube protein Hcp [Ignavibacteriota bacterium]